MSVIQSYELVDFLPTYYRIKKEAVVFRFFIFTPPLLILYDVLSESGHLSASASI